MKLSSQSNHLVICKHCVYSFLNTLMLFFYFSGVTVSHSRAQINRHSQTSSITAQDAH